MLYLGTNLPHRTPTPRALQDKLLAELGNCLENFLNSHQGDLKLPPRREQNCDGKCSFSPWSDFLHRKIGNRSSREPTPSILMKVD